MDEKEEDWADDSMIDIEDYDPSLYALDVTDALKELETD